MGIRPFFTLLFWLLTTLGGTQCWYLNIVTGELKCLQDGSERLAAEGLLAVAKGDTIDLVEQLPHALDAYGIAYNYQENGLLIHVGDVYKAWRLMQAGEDIQSVLGVLMLVDLFSNIRGAQVQVAGRFFQKGFPKLALNQASQVWRLPAVQRGVEIEILRAGNYRLPHGFPVVDIFKNGIAISVKSVDITLPAYQGSRLWYRLKGYVNKLIDFKGWTYGGRTVPPNALKELEIVIPKGKASAAQQKIFKEVTDYGQLNHIIVKFIEL